MSEHTKEPWKLCEVGDNGERLCPASYDNLSILTVVLEHRDNGGLLHFGAVYNPYDARRIIACVNACAGMADPAAELAALRERVKSSYPKTDPITGAPHFMDIEHPQKGMVPTYGGPFESYTLCERDVDECEPELVKFCREKFDHDEGCWTDTIESIGIVAVKESRIEKLESDNAALRERVKEADKLIRDWYEHSHLDDGRYYIALNTAEYLKKYGARATLGKDV